MKFSKLHDCNSRLSVERVAWSAAAGSLSEIRRRVFIEEQGVPEQLEWDGLDASAQHVLATIEAQPVASGRLLATGQIGRMAVLPEFRKQGIGGLVLARLLELAHAQGLGEVFLHAQLGAQLFYARRGFASEGEVFAEAGIPHISMRRRVRVDEPSAP